MHDLAISYFPIAERQHGSEALQKLRAEDIAEIAAMYNYTNRLASATGMLPNPEYHGLAR